MDPQIVQILRELAADGHLPLAGSDVEHARDAHRRMTAQMTASAHSDRHINNSHINDSHIDDVIAQDIEIAAPGAELAARVYRPGESAEVRPTVLYLHGGGHVLGDLDTHDWHARAMCADTGSVVVSLDYRKAPEYQWPVAVIDSRAAFAWIGANVLTLGGDRDRIGIAGDSAGANLAAAVLNHLPDGDLRARAALLLYPAADFSLARAYPSRLEFGGSGYLTVTDMGWFGLLYAGKGAPVDDPDLSPVMADVSRYPPTVVAVAQLDPLHDEGVAIARKMADSGVDVVLLDEEGMPHGFYDFAQRSERARAAVDRCHTIFARHLST